MHLKYLLCVGLCLVPVGGVTPLLAAAASVPAPNTAPTPTVIEMIVAKVNGEVITKTELDERRAAIAADLVKKDPSLSGAKLDEAVQAKAADLLREQIDQLLLVQRAKDLGISVEGELTKQIAQVQADSKKLDPEEFHRWVQEQTGLPFEDVKNHMRDDMLTRKVIGQEVGSHVQVPQAELKDYYEKHKTDFVRQEQVFLREILVAPKSDSPEDVAAAEKKAKDLSARARKGEKFGDLARSYSDAPTASQDGELGAYKRGDLRKEIEDAVFKANRGYVTEPIRTNTGFVILKVEERFEAGQASFEDAQNEIMEKLYLPKMQPEIRKYLTKLREEAFIELRPGYTDSGAAPGKDTTWQDTAQLKPETTTKAEVASHKKKRIMGIIPRRHSDVSSSDPSSASKTPAPAAAAPASTPATPAAPPATPATGSSSSSSTPSS
jgi:parvulin-like peptidyl-prolyl isomerase